MKIAAEQTKAEKLAAEEKQRSEREIAGRKWQQKLASWSQPQSSKNQQSDKYDHNQGNVQPHSETQGFGNTDRQKNYGDFDYGQGRPSSASNRSGTHDDRLNQGWDESPRDNRSHSIRQHNQKQPDVQPKESSADKEALEEFRYQEFMHGKFSQGSFCL